MNMEMIKKSLVIAGAAAVTATGAMAAEATIGVDFASSYIFRGVTFNDEPVMQPYLEVTGLEIAGKAITVGTWANYDFSSTGESSESGEFTEVDFYASIDLGAGFGLGYCQYTYPSVSNGDAYSVETSPVDSDKEMSMSYGTEVAGVELSAAAYYMVGGAYAESVYLEMGAGYGVDISEDLSVSFGATIGCQAVAADDAEADTEEGFSNYTLTTGLAYALSETTELTTSLTYVGAIDNEVIDVDKEFLAVVGVSHSF
jgi:uncharacterized protein (TIGR02001 family)